MDIQEKIVEKIKQFETIIIYRHLFPDPDALGAQGGLQKSIQTSFPDKNVYVVGEEEERLKFLHSMDTVQEELHENALMIVLDTDTITRISDNRYSQGEYLIKIDHHPEIEIYGDLNWVDTSFSSTSEMVYSLVQHSNDLCLSDEAARLLFAGIIGDTGRFRYPNTTEQTMRYASELLRFNFTPQHLYNELYKESRNVAKLKATVLFNHEVSENGVAHFIMTKSLMHQFNVTANEASNLVNCLSTIEGNRIWLFFIEGRKDYRVRIRSKEIPVDDIARQFGGGGHELAAGLSVKDLNQGRKLIQALDQKLKDN